MEDRASCIDEVISTTMKCFSQAVINCEISHVNGNISTCVGPDTSIGFGVDCVVGDFVKS